MEIVLAQRADAAALKRLALAAKAHWGYPPEWMERWGRLVHITPDYISKNLVWKAMDGDRVIAWTALAGRGERRVLDHLWVRPEWMRQGVGRRLFEHVLEQATGLGVTLVEIESDPNALGFYLKMGARQVGLATSAIERDLPILEVRIEQGS